MCSVGIRAAVKSASFGLFTHLFPRKVELWQACTQLIGSDI
jgi:hypothetical protein